MGVATGVAVAYHNLTSSNINVNNLELTTEPVTTPETTSSAKEVRNMNEYSTDQISDLIISIIHNTGKIITNMKLQKLLYYSQAWYLAYFDKPLFDEDFEAWVYGPALPSQYKRFKKYSSGPITETPQIIKFPKSVIEFVTEIIKTFNPHDTYELSLMTHREAPWLNARKGIPEDEPSNNIIDKADMKKYYRSIMQK